MKATATRTGETKNKVKFRITAGLADLGTLYFPKGRDYPESFEVTLDITLD